LSALSRRTAFSRERRRIPSDGGLAGLFDAGHAPVQRGDQLAELTGEIVRGYRHGFMPERRTSRRATFHTSPHFSQRQ
jgi:hypothetical protein